MSERIGESAWPVMAKEVIKRTELVEVFEQGGFKAAGEYFLEQANIKINYEHDKSPEFAADRHRLQTEAGLIVCNHPGYVEIPAILQALERPDVKIMINKSLYPEFSKQFGEQHFVPNVKTPRELIEIMKQITDHIKEGGAFLLFPTGGENPDEYDNGNHPQFKSGVRSILSRLQPDNMVYSFYVDPEQSFQLRRYKIPTFVGMASEILTAGKLNINKLRETQEIKVNENYTKAGEWQELFKQSKDKHKQDDLLAEFYFNQFENKS